MKCDYCFYRDEQRYQYQCESLMQIEILDDIFAKALEFADESAYFCFQGGEPLLAGVAFFEEAIRLQKKNNHKNLKIFNSIQTNGIALDEGWCEFFKQNGFLVGVSLDGIRETHDKHRITLDHRPTYDRVTGNIEILRKYGVDFNILTVVNYDTVNHIGEIYQEYKERKYRYQQYILARTPLFQDHSSFPYSVSAGAYGNCLVTLFDLWKADIYAGNVNCIRQFENYVGIIWGIAPENCEQVGICGKSYAFEADGEAYPCDFYMIPQYSLGNIAEKSFADFDKKRSAIRFVEKSSLISDKCRKCKCFAFCRNGCQRNRIREEDGTSLDYYCEAYQFFFANRGRQLYEVAEYLWRWR